MRVLLIVLTTVGVYGEACAQTQSMWVGAGGSDHKWSTADNWAPAQIPNNGLDTFEVTADGATIELDLPIEISKLVLNLTSGVGVAILSAGQSLTVDGPTIVDNGQFLVAGTFLPQGIVDIDGTLLLNGWQMFADDILLGTGGGNNSSIRMSGAAYLECAGMLEILDDSDIQNFGGAPFISSSGTLLKSGGAGLSSIAVPFENNGGVVQVATGLLSFTDGGVLTGGTIAASGSSIASLSGPFNSSGTINLNATDSATIRFNNAIMESAATLTGAGTDFTATIEATGGATRFSNITLDFRPPTPFQIKQGIFGENGQVVNRDHAEWFAGTIKGGGLLNDGPGAFDILPGVPGSRIIDDGALTNQGIVNHLTTVTLATNGRVENNGLWQIVSPTTVNPGAGATNTLFDNNSMLTVDLPSINNDALINVPFDSSGTIKVRNGELKLHLPNLDGGIVLVDSTATDPNAPTRVPICSIGRDGTSVGSVRNTSFSMVNADAQFLGGQITISGTLTTGGTGSLRNQANLIATQVATLDADVSAPFVMIGDLRADAVVNNEGEMRWIAGCLTGSGELFNQDMLRVVGTLAISAPTMAGNLHNGSAIEFENGSSMIMGDNSRLINDPNATLHAVGDVTVFDQPNVVNRSIINSGLVRKTGAQDLDIRTIYEQSATGRTEAQQGVIALTGSDALLLGGVLAATGANASIQIATQSESSDLTYEFNNDGEVVFQGSGTTLHRIGGILPGSGAGRGVLRAGTLRPVGGAAGLEFVSPALFQIEAGTFGAVGTGMSNHGVMRQSGGFVVGDFTNAGPAGGADPNLAGAYTFVGGRIQGVYRNDGSFLWQEGGNVEGPFTNNAAMTLAESDTLLLAAGASLTNNGDVTHTGGATLELGENTQITNAAGANYVFDSSGGDITRASSAIENAEFTNIGMISQESGITSGISVKFENQGGTLQAISGDLRINGVPTVDGDPIINSGAIRAMGGDIFLSFPQLLGSIVHATGALSTIRHTQPTINTDIVGAGSGRVEIDGGTINALALFLDSDTDVAFQGAPQAPAHVTSTNGALRFEGCDYLMHKNGVKGSVDANSNVAFAKRGTTARVLLAGADSGARQPFRVRFSHDATLEDEASLVLDGTIEFINDGTFKLASRTGDIDALDLNDNDILFTNNGVFEKSQLPNNIGSQSGVTIHFANNNTVRTRAGSLSISPFCDTMSGNHLLGGTWIIDPNSSLTLNLDTPILESDAEIVLRGNGVFTNLPTAGTTDTFQNDGTLCLQGGAMFTTGGEFENNGSLKVESGSTLTAETLDNDGPATIDGTLNFTQAATFQSGCVRGRGVINGSSITNNGCVGPGNSPGRLTINADLSNTAAGELEIELAGRTAETEHDVLTVNGAFALDGTLRIALLNGFEPDPNDTFSIITGSVISGSFANAADPGSGVGRARLPGGSFAVEYAPDAVRLTDFAPCPGDLSGDGMVNLGDLSALLGSFGLASGATPADGDLDGDGDVDLSDLSGFLTYFGSICA